MKDGHRILEMVRTIQLVEKNQSVSVLTSAPVCSKTKLFLNENNIEMNEMG